MQLQTGRWAIACPVVARVITEAYQETYDQIASDHVSFWHQNDGRNPFQDPTVMWKNEQATLELIRDYAPKGPMLDVGCGMGAAKSHLWKASPEWL